MGEAPIGCRKAQIMNPSTGGDVYCLPHAHGGYLIYAPLAGRVAHVNAACAIQIRRFLISGDPREVPSEVAGRLGGLAWLKTAQVPRPLPADRHFHPCEVTLFLTNRCNLRCRYCYAAAGDKRPLDMPLDTMRAAINLVARNARLAGRAMHVGFHGGGEPTQNGAALEAAVAYARETAAAEGTGPVQFYIATNGVMTAPQREFVASECAAINLSLDGPPDIHDAARPTTAGGGSFDAVMAFVEVLRRHKRAFSIRSTITAANVARMTEMVAYFHQSTECRLLHFEPAFAGGRCRNDGTAVPGWAEFASEFIKAHDEARRRGIELRFSASRLEQPSFCFCGCANDPFTVTPEGFVTACYEVCDGLNPRAEQYIFGRHHPDGFHFDYPKLARLRKLTVDNKPFCRFCFAKWVCAGDCPIKAHHPYAEAASASPRCKATQRILRSLLERVAVNPEHKSN